MPVDSRRRVDRWVIRSPSKKTSPAVMLVSPRIVLSSVERPAPLAPTTLTHSPASTVRLMSNRTGSRPYPARIPLSSSIGILVTSLVGLAEVHRPDLGIGDDVVGAAGGDQATLAEDVNQVALPQDGLDVVLDEQHGEAEVLLQLAQQDEQRIGLVGVEPRR